MSDPILIQNACYLTKEDTYLVCTGDPVSYAFDDGRTLTIAGSLGKDGFAQRSGDYITLDRDGRYQEWCLTDQDDLHLLAERLLRYAYTKDGIDVWEPVNKLTNESLTDLVNDPDLHPTTPLWRTMQYLRIKRAQGGAQTHATKPAPIEVDAS